MVAVASAIGGILGGISAALIIASISILSSPFFFSIAISQSLILLAVILFQAGILFAVIRKCVLFPHYGYRIAINAITLFAIIFFGLKVLIDYSPSLGLPSEINSVIHDSFVVLPLAGLSIAVSAFISSLAAGTPIRNKYASRALVMGTLSAFNFIPFMVAGIVLLNSFNTFFHEFIFIGVPVAIAEGIVNKDQFRGNIMKFVVLENLILLPIALNNTILFMVNTSWFSKKFLFPLDNFIASLFILVVIIIILLKFVEGLNNPFAFRKIIVAIPVAILSYLILAHFSLLPDIFLYSSFNYSELLGKPFIYNLAKAIILVSIIFLVGRIIAQNGGKGTAAMGSTVIAVLAGLYLAGYNSSHFQYPLMLGLGLSAAVIFSSDAIAIAIKSKTLHDFDLMKTSTSNPPQNRIGASSGGSVYGASNTNPSRRASTNIPRRVPELWIGRNISGYVMKSIISKDTGFAFVMRGSRPNEPDVAVKILKPYSSEGTKIAFNNEFLRKFLTEFQNVMVLNGKKYVVNIIGVTVNTYPDDSTKMAKYQENPPAIVMELLMGGKLSDLLFKYTTNSELELFFEICTRIAQGLQDAHDRKVLHGDIKPDNIMFLSRNGMNIAKYSNSAGEIAEAIRRDIFVPKIVDFGSAKIRGFGDTVFSQFSVLYSPPEILINDYDTDETYDVYEFGLVMYYMLAGCLNDSRLSKIYAKRQLFIERKVNTSSFYSDLNQLIYDASLFPNEDLQSINPMVKRPLNYIISRCIDPNPSGRYRDMKDVRNAMIHCANKDYGYTKVGTT
ncbi:MAG: protein kinase domain-containing protein [Thermoplasmataceae archaeon]